MTFSQTAYGELLTYIPSPSVNAGFSNVQEMQLSATGANCEVTALQPANSNQLITNMINQ